MLQVELNRNLLLTLLTTANQWHPFAIEWVELYFENLLVAFTRRAPLFHVATPTRRPPHVANYMRLVIREGGKCGITGLWSAYCPQTAVPTGHGVILTEMAHIIPHMLNNNTYFHGAVLSFAGINRQLLTGKEISDTRNCINMDRTLYKTMDDRLRGLEPILGSTYYRMVHVVQPARSMVVRCVPHGT